MHWIFFNQEIYVNSFSLSLPLCACVCLVTLARAISVYLSLISRLCACVVRYVRTGRDERREAITLLLLVILQELQP